MSTARSPVNRFLGSASNRAKASENSPTDMSCSLFNHSRASSVVSSAFAVDEALSAPTAPCMSSAQSRQSSFCSSVAKYLLARSVSPTCERDQARRTKRRAFNRSRRACHSCQCCPIPSVWRMIESTSRTNNQAAMTRPSIIQTLVWS